MGRSQQTKNRVRRTTAPAGAAAVVLFAIIILGGGVQEVSFSPPDIDTCADGIDNDNDGSIDGLDPECDEFHPLYDGVEDGDG